MGIAKEQDDAGSGGLPIAAAGGTADAITATYSPVLTLTDKVLALFVASGANTTTTPTFAPDGLTAHTITARGGAALYVGDIPAADYVAIVEYNAANTRWELLNPCPRILPLAAGGTNKNMTASAGAVVFSDADSLELTAVGTSGQVLKSGGTGTPTWANDWNYITLLNGDATNATNVVADIANGGQGLNFSVAANSLYLILADMRIGCSGVGGVNIGWSFPAAATLGICNLVGRLSSATVQSAFGVSISATTLGGTAYSTDANANGTVSMVMLLTTGANSGTFSLQFASVTNTQTSTVYKDSTIMRHIKLS